MGLAATLIFYLTIGAGVAVAVFVTDERSGSAERLFRTLSALVFWPLYVPLLLQPIAVAPPTDAQPQGHPAPADQMAAAIMQVEVELDRALGSLDGWAEDVLSLEQERLAELRQAWRAQAARIRELDELLNLPAFTGAVEASESTPQRSQASEQSRRDNIARLRTLRRQLHDDLMGTLSWVRELVTMIHLAKFTGAPASRAQELVAQIAAAVEGLSEVSAWQEEAASVG